jgi:hypothetical protein
MLRPANGPDCRAHSVSQFSFNTVRLSQVDSRSGDNENGDSQDRQMVEGPCRAQKGNVYSPHTTPPFSQTFSE